MLRVIASSSIVLALTWLNSPVGAGFAWDMLNGLGFLAIGVFGALLLDNLRPVPAKEGEPPIRERLLQHSRLGHVALLLVLLHAGGLLILDPLLLEYLKPSAPLYMVVGAVGLLLLAGMIWSAAVSRRRRLHRTQGRFRLVHRILGVVVLGSVAWHVVGAGFYLDHVLQKLALIGLMALLILAPRPAATFVDRFKVRPNAKHAGAGLLALLVLHTLARNL